ncbi:hypothetical protein [Clostridium paraputrificum]|uniref:Uncharacterized protein n=1 Tax=Clostridium paraputrificum TaxID=29363 RepID=A0A6N2Z559_9CLOT|nr:hypothetical protein [Clostridium sp.]MBS5987342.1 hypothetical protein [Clostridium sp.]
MVCSDCGSDRIESGKITNMYGVIFKAESSKFMFPRESSISAKVCLDCGKLFDFKADEVEKLNK